MHSRVSKSWNSLTKGKPGHRFRDRYHRNQQSGTARGWVGQVVRLVLAALALVVGVVLVFIPGPAIVFFILAGALLASDWLWLARVMDGSEVRLRRLADWAQRAWKQLPTGGRIALVSTGAMVSAAAMYGFYCVMR